MNHKMSYVIRNRHFTAALAVAVLTAVISSYSTASEAAGDQRTFPSAQSAVEALLAAVKSGDTDGLLAIFGTQGRELLSSGDPVQDKRNLAVFAVALQQQWTLGDVDERSKELIIGDEAWPFPIPLVQEPSGWRFDTAAGKQEVLARRIGRNELAVISVCRIYGNAQREYAGRERDGGPAGVYAQRIRSTPGKHDGLYWAASSPDEEASPLSELAAKAADAGYSATAREGTTPFYGYYYRILTRQGENAPGGEKDFIVNGQMTGGFALIAYPAEYGNSGIMTFMVSHDGVVYEKDLGADTADLAVKIEAYDPGAEWLEVR